MLTAKQKQAIRKTVRLGIQRGYEAHAKRSSALHQTINERAYWRSAFDFYSENGVVAVCRSGMDCDCVSYQSLRHIDTPKSVVAWCRDEDEHQRYLDGPESMWLERPTENPEYRHSRDLALEAYEDGHPHVVYAGGW